MDKEVCIRCGKDLQEDEGFEFWEGLGLLCDKCTEEVVDNLERERAGEQPD